MCKTLGIKTDIDLRSAHERFGMTGSPLGPDVKFATLEDELHGYSAIHTVGAEDMRRVLRVFLDRANYPIDFHCIGGADRTGTVAAVLLGILGVDDDEIWKDYQITAWHGGVNDAKHLGWFTAFMKSSRTSIQSAASCLSDLSFSVAIVPPALVWVESRLRRSLL